MNPHTKGLLHRIMLRCRDILNIRCQEYQVRQPFTAYHPVSNQKKLNSKCLLQECPGQDRQHPLLPMVKNNSNVQKVKQNFQAIKEQAYFKHIKQNMWTIKAIHQKVQQSKPPPFFFTHLRPK